MFSLSSLGQELSDLQNKLEKERQQGLEHKMALEAQVNEAQAHIKVHMKNKNLFCMFVM